MRKYILCFLIACSFCSAVVIDFSTVDLFRNDGNNIVLQIGAVSFSHSLYSHPDGFRKWQDAPYTTNPVVYNWYGERREYLQFAAPVYLQSLDASILQYSYALPKPTTMIFEMYNASGTLLNTVVWGTPGNSLQTIALNQYNVSKLVIDFTGGADHYSDGRMHAWYALDNIVYDTAVPEPASFALFLLAFGILLFQRNR